MKLFSMLILPFLVLGILLIAGAQKVDLFRSFTKGATSGALPVLDIIPALVGLFVAIGVFRASGAMELAVRLLTPIGKAVGLDGELLPLILMRPVSGSASLALVQDVIERYGADSYLGTAAAVMMGSTETVFYTMAVYMGGNGIKKAAGVLPAALAANFVSALAACWLCG